MKGIGAVSGVALKLLFMDAHLKVQDKTEIFGEYLQRRANLVKAYISAAKGWSNTPYYIRDNFRGGDIEGGLKGEVNVTLSIKAPARNSTRK